MPMLAWCKRPLVFATVLGAGVFLGSATGSADGPVGTPHPPTDPSIAQPLGILGIVLPGQTLFHSTYDSGKVFVGTQYFPRLWYRFSTAFGEATTMQFRRWTATSGATYKLYDQNLRFVGDLTDPNLQISKFSDYFIEVSAGGPTWAHFAIEIRPAVDAFQNDAGDSIVNATDLGVLNKVITHVHQFYTYYTRAQPDLYGDSEIPSILAPNFQTPDPAVSKAFYSFRLPRPSNVKIFAFNQDADTYVIRRRGSSDGAVVQNGAIFLLSSSGDYTLEIVDKHTSISGSAEFRDPRIENFENQSFELLVTDTQGQTPENPPNPPNGVQVSPLGPPPTPACIVIGSQRINCP